MKQRLVLGGLALAAIGVTCGGDGSAFSSGVNKDAEIGSLSSGDVQRVCESLHTWMQDNLLKVVKEMSCRTQGFGEWVSGSDSATQKQTACTMAYDQCMKQPTEASEPAMCDDKPSAACKATVGELESCFNGLVPVMRQVLEGFPTCAQIASGAMPYPPGDLQPPAACKSLESKCPEWELPASVDLATEP